MNRLYAYAKKKKTTTNMIDDHVVCFRSRLGCQVIVTKDMQGWDVHVPAGVADAREP